MLTPSQYATLKAAILADSSLADEVASADDMAIAAAFNLTATPDFWVRKSRLTKSEIYGSPSVDGTIWSWPTFNGRTQGERDGWRELFADGYVDPSLPNINQAVADIFSGSSGGAPQQRAHLLAIARRKATRFEKLLVVSGTGTTADAAIMGVEGPVSYAVISLALRG